MGADSGQPEADQISRTGVTYAEGATSGMIITLDAEERLAVPAACRWPAYIICRSA